MISNIVAYKNSISGIDIEKPLSVAKGSFSTIKMLLLSQTSEYFKIKVTISDKKEIGATINKSKPAGKTPNEKNATNGLAIRKNVGN
jgi:hypothetical protein